MNGVFRPLGMTGLGAAALLSCQMPFETPAAQEALDAVSGLEAPESPARRTAALELTSDAMSGLFKATVVAAGGADPRIRMQWHGGAGEKVLDLAAGPEGFSGYVPLAGIGIQAGWSDPPPRHFLTFLACSLLEQAAPLTPGRVLGSRRGEAGWELQVAPVAPGLRLRVEIGPDGALRARHYAWRGVGWTERFDPHRFESRGFLLILHEETVAPLGAEPEAGLFQLELPAGAHH